MLGKQFYLKQQPAKGDCRLCLDPILTMLQVSLTNKLCARVGGTLPMAHAVTRIGLVRGRRCQQPCNACAAPKSTQEFGMLNNTLP